MIVHYLGSTLNVIVFNNFHEFFTGVSIIITSILLNTHIYNAKDLFKRKDYDLLFYSKPFIISYLFRFSTWFNRHNLLLFCDNTFESKSIRISNWIFVSCAYWPIQNFIQHDFCVNLIVQSIFENKFFCCSSKYYHKCNVSSK